MDTNYYSFQERIVGDLPSVEYCEVTVNRDGDRIKIETDEYEGVAIMRLPLAMKVHKALGRAIKKAKEVRIAKGLPLK